MKKTIANKKIENGLYIICTPIGNLDDLSKRAESVLNDLDLIICESPKHSVKLLNKLGIKKKLISLHDHNEDFIIKKISARQHNAKIGLISDAGAPLISDPGYNLVNNFIKKKIKITAIPGASSLITSLQVSGMPLNSFIFYGFIPKSLGKTKELLKEFLSMNKTGVFFVSGKNLTSFVKVIKESDPNIEIALCKELTKINENIYRGGVAEMFKKLNESSINLKGEFTVVLSSKIKKVRKSININVENQISLLLKKYSLTETVKIVHNLSNISKNEVYAAAIKIKDK